MNSYARASVHHQHAHMILDAYAAGQLQCRWCPGQSQTKFALRVFTGHQCHESLFHTWIAVQHPKSASLGHMMTLVHFDEGIIIWCNFLW